VREGKPPPIAHKDFGGADLAAIAQAEAAAPSMLQVDQSRPRHSVSMPLFVTMVAVACLSLVFNVVLLVMRGT
jgi:hypothetical protein